MQATKTRYWVVVFAVTLAILSYIDRVSISIAKPQMTRDLGLSTEQFGQILAAFGLGYALFEIPGGFLADWMGPRKVIARIVLWWSAFTALTGYVSNITVLWWVRFLFGCGEAGAFPVMTKAFSIWLKPDEKSRAQGVMWTFARLGGAITPFIVTPIINAFDWRTAFAIFGLMGVFWVIIWWLWFRDSPSEHKSVNQAEALLLAENEANAGSHTDVPWAGLVQSRSIWLLWAQYFCLSYSWYFYITWLPTYLREFKGTDADLTKTLSFFPLAFGAAGCLFSGFFLPYLTKWVGSMDRARRVLASIGFAGAAVFLLTSMQIKDPTSAILVMAIGSFFNDLVMPPAWGTCMDVGGKYAGTVAGSMNMMGNFAGFFAPWIGGAIVQRTGGDWHLFLYTMVIMYVGGALCWPFINTMRPVELREAAHAHQ